MIYSVKVFLLVVITFRIGTTLVGSFDNYFTHSDEVYFTGCFDIRCLKLLTTFRIHFLMIYIKHFIYLHNFNSFHFFKSRLIYLFACSLKDCWSHSVFKKKIGFLSLKYFKLFLRFRSIGFLRFIAYWEGYLLFPNYFIINILNCFGCSYCRMHIARFFTTN